MTKFKKITVILTLFALLCLPCVAVSVESHSWYFKPAKNNRQPELIPEVSSFINEYDVISMGDEAKAKIYLTFDAGYENGNVEKILDVLKEKNVKGAFFILPQLAKQNNDLVLRMKNEGHLVCNHTKSHKDMSKIYDFQTFKYELEENERIFKESTGLEMDKYYRPPEGRFSEQNLKWAEELGYTTVFWSLAYADWDNSKQLDPRRALDLISSRTHNGCVALLHPTSSTNATILGDYIDKMRECGYEFCSIADFEKANTGEN